MSAPQQKPIEFWFDFASPFAYFALPEIERLAAESGRTIAWRPVILWAVLKAQNLAAPAASPAKWAYLLRDMERSAAFYRRPFVMPRFPLSAHLAARLFYGATQTQPHLARDLAVEILEAHIAHGEAITDPETLTAIAARAGVAEATAREAMTGGAGRALLEAAVSEAVTKGMIGSPYIMLDDEPFFGADRLPQVAWRLNGGGAG